MTVQYIIEAINRELVKLKSKEPKSAEKLLNMVKELQEALDWENKARKARNSWMKENPY